MLRLLCPPPSLTTGPDVVGFRTAEVIKSLGLDCKCHYLWPDFLGHLFAIKHKGILGRFYVEVICRLSVLAVMFKIRKGDWVWINSISRLGRPNDLRLEKYILRKGARYIYHLQDLILDLDNYRGGTLKRIAMSDLTVVVSHELKKQVLKEQRDANVKFLEEPIDVERVQPVSTSSKSRVPVLVWTGNVSNLTNHFSTLVDVLADVYKEFPFVLRIISGVARPSIDLPFPFEWLPFNLKKEKEYLAGATAGLAPLQDTVYARCKDVYKVKTYMAAGIVPLASRVGHNLNVVKHGETGFLMNSQEEWKAGLTTILADEALASKMGVAAREYCVKHFSHDTLGPIWVDALREHLVEE
jgi:glycosyltransferase involved in cell wall biosynthesis